MESCRSSCYDCTPRPLLRLVMIISISCKLGLEKCSLAAFDIAHNSMRDMEKTVLLLQARLLDSLVSPVHSVLNWELSDQRGLQGNARRRYC